MEKRKISFVFTAIIILFAFLFGACPIFDDEEDDDEEITIVFPAPGATGSKDLNSVAWLNLLTDIAKQNKKVHLDLRNSTHNPNNDNERGGLREVDLYDDSGLPTVVKYIAFDPYPRLELGKDKIVSIILPDRADMVIYSTTDGLSGLNKESDKDASAFRFFKNLRSVSAANVTLIGNYAFYECKSLTKVNFPSVGHRAKQADISYRGNYSFSDGFRIDIGHYAFAGCTGLADVTFDLAAGIGAYSFSGCTRLRRISFPKTWVIFERAFEGCVGLTEINFESAIKIHDYAFEGCNRLQNAYFRANPVRFNIDIDKESVIFYTGAFSGCSALKLLDIRYAWNVLFLADALEKIGTTLDIYLYDGIEGIGHPQREDFAGTAGAISLREINLIVPMGSGNINEASGPVDNIAMYIKDNFTVINDLNIKRRSFL